MKKFLCYDTNDAASGKIEVDNRGMLKPNSTVPSGSAPYKQLVTDGTGTAKWEDRLAYAVKANELIAEQTITTYESEAYGYTAELNGSLRLEEGKIYFVNFDGKDYECVAWSYPERGAICIGNGSIIGADRGNSEPFAFDESDGYIYLDVEEPETHKVSIYAGDTIPVYYDYMPKNMRVIIEDNGKGGGTCNATFSNIAYWISSGIPIMAVRIRANGPVINMANIQYITFNVNSGELRLHVSNDFSYLYSEDGTISYPVVS